MPFKNVENFLGKTLKSIKNQSYSNFELIAVNDHSIDNSVEIFKSFSKLDERFILLENKGRGIIPALITGEKLAKGNFISRMDADDLMAENRVEVLIDNLVKNDSNSVAVGGVKYFSDSKKINQGYRNYEFWLNNLSRKGENFKDIYKECPIPSPCWMMHKSTFNKIGGFSKSIYPEDYDLAFRMYKNELEIIPELKLLHYWRDHYQRASRNDENYLDNAFWPLKVKYFLEIDCSDKSKIAVWGAGKKGKELVKNLINKSVTPNWYCNNKNKIGKEIYGVKLQDSSQVLKLDSNYQIIVSVSNPEDKIEIETQLKSDGRIKNHDYFMFV